MTGEVEEVQCGGRGGSSRWELRSFDSVYSRLNGNIGAVAEKWCVALQRPSGPAHRALPAGVYRYFSCRTAFVWVLEYRFKVNGPVMPLSTVLDPNDCSTTYSCLMWISDPEYDAKHIESAPERLCEAYPVPTAQFQSSTGKHEG